MKYLAIDVGGTSTRVALIDDGGTCLGYGSDGSGNPTSAGVGIAAASIVSATQGALQAADVDDADVAAGTVAIAGAAGGNGVALLAEVASAGVSIPLTLEPDLLGAFCAGTLAVDGYAIVAGTGAAAVRVRDLQLDATSDGLGWLLGDGGSGFWIGRRAVRAVAAALDGRGPDTELVGAVLAELGIPGNHRAGTYGRPVALSELLHAIYRLRPVELARFAPSVFAAAARGDEASALIVGAAADELIATLSTVLDPGTPGPLVLCGSLLARQPRFADRVVMSFRAAMGDSLPAIAVSDGLPGAAALALRRAGVRVDDAVFDRLQRTLAARR